METAKVLETINKFKKEGKTKKELALILEIGEKTFTYHYNKLIKAGSIEKIDDQTVITKEVIKELETYFTYDLTDEQACLMAKIKTGTFYNYCRENPEWATFRNVLKNSVVTNAKIKVAKKIKEGKDDSYIKMVYQEDKRKDRANIKLELGIWKEEEEEIEAKNISLKVTIK